MAPPRQLSLRPPFTIDAAILEKYSPLPVGRVMPGTKIFIVDENGAELSANKRGEIIITGPNVSPGYAGRPDLTARAFFEYRGLARIQDRRPRPLS